MIGLRKVFDFTFVKLHSLLVQRISKLAGLLAGVLTAIYAEEFPVASLAAVGAFVLVWYLTYCVSWAITGQRISFTKKDYLLTAAFSLILGLISALPFVIESSDGPLIGLAAGMGFGVIVAYLTIQIINVFSYIFYVVFKRPHEFQFVPNGHKVNAVVGKRWLARILDVVIIYSTFLLFVGIMSAFELGDFGFVICASIAVAVIVLLDSYFLGQSIGKRMFGIYTVDSSSLGPPAAWQFLVRNLTFYFPIVNLFDIGAAVFRRDSRRLGDIAADTEVLQNGQWQRRQLISGAIVPDTIQQLGKKSVS